MSDAHPVPAWRRYEFVAAEILNSIASEFGVDRFEGKQSLAGASGATWEIDAKGVSEDGDVVVLVECRRTRARQSQEKLGALAWKLLDTGADAGIIVSPLPLQVGAQKVAAAGRIHYVQLDANSSIAEFAVKFLNKLFIGVADTAWLRDEVSATVDRRCGSCSRIFAAVGLEANCPSCSA